MNPSPTLPLEERGPVALLDGEHGFGPRVALKAVEAAQSLARRHGLGAVGVRRSTHFGMAGLYAEKLAREGFVAWVTTNAEPDVVPFGGGRRPWAPTLWPSPPRPLRGSSWPTWPPRKAPWARSS